MQISGIKRLMAAAVLTLGLGACSTVGGLVHILGSVKITQSQIDLAHETYTGVFLSWAAQYRVLYNTNPCPTGVHATLQNVCAERAVVVRLQSTDLIVKTAFDRVQTDYNACVAGGQAACEGLTAAYNTLSTAITAAKALAVEYKIGG